MEELWRVLEFYSGIGGMRYSLMTAGIGAEVVEAFDINDRANDVYECNFGHRPFQGNIQSLTAKELDKYGAHAWLLSPPCQPYTRQGLQKHSADARASSFIKILDLIPHMLQPPLLLFVENVVGFETSDTHKQMMEALAKTGFVTQEYILSPLQFGIPYSRPRYFCLAKRKPSSFQKLSYNNQLLWTPPFLASEGNISIDGLSSLDIRQESIHIPCQPIRNFLELRTLYIDQAECIEETFCLQDNISTLDLEDDINCTPTSCAPQDPANTHSTTNGIGDEVEGSVSDKDAFNRYIVPLSLIERWGSAMDKILEHRTDVVYPDSKRCCCFTKSYYRYVKGTGSLLATSEGTKRESAKRNEVSSLKELNLRYFTPREVANLHSLPEDFHFPPHISLRQQYALLGNSLSIAVVAPLLRYLFAESG